MIHGSKPHARKRFGGALALAMCAALPGCGAFSTASTYEDAASAFEAGQYRIANAHLADLLTSGEVDERVRMLQVQLMLTIGDGNRAMAAIDELPESVLGGVYRRIAVAHAQILQAAPQKTIELYENLPPEEFTEQDHRMQLWALREAGETGKFREKMVTALAQFPDSPYLNALVADYYYDLRSPAEAERFANIAFENGPDILEARLVAGRRAIFEGDLEKAIVHYNAANDINPSNALALTNVVGLHLDLGQVEKAGEVLKPAIENHGGFPFLQWQLARYKLATGDVQGAREAKDRVQRIYYDNPEFMLLMGEIEAAFGNKRLALDNYRRFVDEVGEVPEVMDKIAELEG